jgi:hypothetical protein
MKNLSNANLERLEFYRENYRVVRNLEFVAKKPTRLADHRSPSERRCRFCRRSAPEVTFRNKAHAVPEFMGNKSIISMNECDTCNDFFAREYEDHLAKRLGLSRALAGIRGKKGCTTFKCDMLRVEAGENALAIEITDPKVKSVMPETLPHVIKLPDGIETAPHVPIRAAQALVKAACSLVPTALLPECCKAIQWLTGRATATAANFPVLHTFTPGPHPYGNGQATILQRTSDAQIPFLWCLIATANFRFQVMVPWCTSDPWMAGNTTTFTMPHFPSPFGVVCEERYGETLFYYDDWAGETSLTIKMNAAVQIDSITEACRGRNPKQASPESILTKSAESAQE